MTQSEKSVELLSKISVKTVYGSINVKKLHEEGAKSIVRVIGLANGVQTGESAYGTWTAFKGNFKAINLETGETFSSAKVFIPAIAQNLIEGALSNASNDAVEFAFDIGIKPAKDSKGADSYEYTVKPLIEASDNDPLAALEKRLSAPALEDKTETKGK